MSRDFSSLKPAFRENASSFKQKVEEAERKRQAEQTQIKITIPLDDIIPYHRERISCDGQTFSIFKDYPVEKLSQLADDIEQNGLIEPIIVFPNLEGKYEVLSGKHRTEASRKVRARHPEDPARAEIAAVIYPYEKVSANDWSFGDLIYVNSNLYRRKNLLPSELGMAYEMQFAAKSHQGKASDEGSINELIARNEGLPLRRVRSLRRIIPDFLIIEIIEMVDNGTISTTTAAGYLSYLNKATQKTMCEWINKGARDPKKIFTRGFVKRVSDLEKQKTNITFEDLELLAQCDKSEGETGSGKIPTERQLKEFIPADYWGDMESFLRKAVEEYRTNHGV